MNDDTSLRERKRLATRRRIEDAATALVEKHGFDNVTVEDICRAADISRRTFFNYMDSKDEAILGAPPLTLSAARQQDFIDTPSDNLVKSALLLIAATHDDNISEDLEAGIDAAHITTVRERRHRIIAADPSVALMSINRFREQSTLMHGLVVKHLERHPGDRKLPTQPLPLEAAMIAGLIREAVWMHMHRPHHDATLAGTGEILTTLTKELYW
ncbi:MAG: TetR family transcriptional regulator [Corynebacterium sp.]|uniref:TetR family transcriptional regulator n=1 Tax=Corynebacterium sp. TaxID=1720 RepID=UPI0026DF682D|nr:TetR/AcrR family transcriptional regulator [Corynebacterium sp.]MDO5668567.1 TetR family transcriptional regulator [Corynebacterium sp.]